MYKEREFFQFLERSMKEIEKENKEEKIKKEKYHDDKKILIKRRKENVR